MLFKKFTNENASERVTVKERLAYGCGDFSSNIMYSAMAAFLLFYYTDVVGVSAAAVGIIMMCSRIFDGISDLIMGVIIDRTKSPFGKARIWILWLVISYAIGTALLFSVPVGWSETAKLIYIFFSYNLAFTVLFTGINLPYATLNLILIFIAQGINGSAEVYYTKIVLGNSDLVGTFSVSLQATQIICIFLLQDLSRSLEREMC